MTAEQAFKTFAGDLEVRRPHLMLCDVADGESIKVSDRGIFDGNRFYVKAAPMVWNAGEATNCCQILLDMEQYQ